jgi:hypothetical protein
MKANEVEDSGEVEQMIGSTIWAIASDVYAQLGSGQEHRVARAT